MKYLSFIFMSGLLALFLFTTSSECDAASDAYIPNQTANTVSVIDLSDNSVIETIDVGGSPTGVAMDVKGGYVYVTNFADDTVSVISSPFHAETTRIPVGNGPLGVVVSPDGEYVYVTNSQDDTVSVLKGTSVIETIAVGDNPLGIAVTPYGEYVYVANNGDNTVTVISTEDDDGNEAFTIEKTIDAEDLELMEGPYGMAASPGGSYVYVTNNVSDTVSVIYTYDHTILSTIDVDDGLGEGPLGVAASPGGSYVYVANNSSNTLSVVSTSSYTVETTVDVGAGPWGVDVRNSGDFVYVTNSLDNTVSVVSTEFDDDGELSVTDTVIVGTTPVGLGRFIGGAKVPEPPTDLVAESASAFEINLSWTDNSDDEYGFKIERTTYGGIYKVIAIVDSNVTSYSNAELSSYTTYYYRVRAYNDAGDSDYTNEALATTTQEESGCFISTAVKGSFLGF